MSELVEILEKYEARSPHTEELEHSPVPLLPTYVMEDIISNLDNMSDVLNLQQAFPTWALPVQDALSSPVIREMRKFEPSFGPFQGIFNSGKREIVK